MAKQTLYDLILLSLLAVSGLLMWTTAPNDIVHTPATDTHYRNGTTILNETKGLKEGIVKQGQFWKQIENIPAIGTFSKNKLDELTQGITRGEYPYWPTVWIGAGNNPDRETIYRTTAEPVTQPEMWKSVLMLMTLLGICVSGIIGMFSGKLSVGILTLINRSGTIIIISVTLWTGTKIVENFYLADAEWLQTTIQLLTLSAAAIICMIANSLIYNLHLNNTYGHSTRHLFKTFTRNIGLILLAGAIALTALIWLGWTPGLTGIKTGYLYIGFIITTFYIINAHKDLRTITKLNKK